MIISERSCFMDEELYLDPEDFFLDEDELIEMA